jgi:hypothetical protein
MLCLLYILTIFVYVSFTALNQYETFAKRLILFKVKKGDPPPDFGGLTTGIH